MKITSLTLAILMMIGLKTRAAELKWVEPFEAAKQEAKQTGKPMLVFIGYTESCKDCQAFEAALPTQPDFIEYAAKNLVCTRVLYANSDSKDKEVKWRKTQIAGSFNLPISHAVIITNPDGKRIGELGAEPQLIPRYIEDHKCPVISATTAVG